MEKESNTKIFKADPRWYILYTTVSNDWVGLLCFTIAKLKVCYNPSVQPIVLHQARA